MPYTVTRQIQWPEGAPMVEVSVGGLDYTNPDALSPKYPGEFETFDDPEEAAQAALNILALWHADGQPEAQMAYGATGGMTMPFDPCTEEELREWARKTKERLTKCARCSAVLGKTRYRHLHLPDDLFCSEYCAEEAHRDQEETREPAYTVCDSCLDVAHDNGVSGRAQQALAMAELGLEMEDHLCDAREHPNVCPKCECACNGRRSELAAMKPL